MHELPKELGGPLPPNPLNLPHPPPPKIDAGTQGAGCRYIQPRNSLYMTRMRVCSLSFGSRISGSPVFSSYVDIWCWKNFLRSAYLCASVSILLPCNRSLCDCLHVCVRVRAERERTQAGKEWLWVKEICNCMLVCVFVLQVQSVKPCVLVSFPNGVWDQLWECI